MFLFDDIVDTSTSASAPTQPYHPHPTRGTIIRHFSISCTCGAIATLTGSHTICHAIRSANNLGWRHRIHRGWTCPACDVCARGQATIATNAAATHPDPAIRFTPHTIPNGIWTIQEPDNRHHTVSIDTQPADASFAAGKRVISLLISPDDYQSFGFVSTDSRRIQVWSKRRGQDGQVSDWEKLATNLTALFLHPDDHHMSAAGYTLHGEATCLRCNRRLTTPESIARGMGAECASRSRAN